MAFGSGAMTNTIGEIRKADCTYRVVKNTLVKLAIAGTEMEGMSGLFRGPCAIAYSFQDRPVELRYSYVNTRRCEYRPDPFVRERD